MWVGRVCYRSAWLFAFAVVTSGVFDDHLQ